MSYVRLSTALTGCPSVDDCSLARAEPLHGASSFLLRMRHRGQLLVTGRESPEYLIPMWDIRPERVVPVSQTVMYWPTLIG